MKIINEKGKIFGRINIIDFLLILIVIVVGAFAAVKLSGGAGGGAEPVSVVYTVQVAEVDPATYEVVKAFVDRQIEKKDQLLTGSSLASGYVVDCVATPHVTYVETDDGRVVAVESSGTDTRLDLVFTLEADITDTVTNAVGTQEVRAGIPYIVKTAHFELQEGVILSASWSYQE